ncbi:MAG: GWxTD domain-containing protein [Acidobacteriota bacterium]
MMERRFLLTGLLFLATISIPPAVGSTLQEKQQRKGQEAQRAEESEDYYDRWLKETVVYIISAEEKSVFESLTTPEEKEQFIEQFWYRRDPDPRTPENEFKTEHYRRIAYANERFGSGDPGWQTDRGRIYILHGQPDSIESRPSGGTYMRTIEEGGGTTAVYPYEKWRYRHIEGVGEDVEIEFVDPTYTGEFRIAVSPWEKDAFLHSPGGATLAEQTGLATKADREAFTPAAGGAGSNPQTMFRRLRDTPFARYEKVAKVGGPSRSSSRT